MTTKLETLQKKNKELKIGLQNRRLERIQNAYDAVDGSSNSKGGGNKRRQARVETSGETGVRGILKPRGRLQSLNLSRDLERNYSNAKSIIHQNKVNIVGPSPKCQVNTKGENGKQDDFGKEVTDWINKKWMKSCDFRSTRRFAKLAQLVVAAQDREGDMLVVFDDDLIKDTGKILFYETDQICDLSDWDAYRNGKEWKQQDGIVYDEWGREIGYITSPKRGQTSVTSEHATVFPRNPDVENEYDNLVRLIRTDYRLIQGRGISTMLTTIADLLDCYEMRSKELQTAKLASSLGGTIEREEAIEDFDDERFDPDAENPSEPEETETTLPEDQDEPENYERLEKLTGGYMDYLAKGDKFTLHDIKRPNVAMKDFLDFVSDASGSAFGLAHSYTRMKADKSYTAFRGEMVMTWVTWYSRQKDLEYDFLDWSTIRAIRWGLGKNKFKATPTKGWEAKISWKLPRMPFVDEGKERDAQAKAIKEGLATYSELLGPNWEETFVELATELEKAKELLLPLGAFETKSGGTSEDGTEKPKPEEEEDE